MASKYIFTIGRNIFSSRGFSARSALILGQSATWWIDGNLVLLPCVLGGLLIVRKSADLISSFLFRRRALTIVLTSGSPIAILLISQYSSFLFSSLCDAHRTLDCTTINFESVVRALVGFFTSIIHPVLLFTELALLVGNLFVALESQGRHAHALKNKLLPARLNFIHPRQAITFHQDNTEWTLRQSSDDRGNRRFFTIASSPTEHTVRLGVKIYGQRASNALSLH